MAETLKFEDNFVHPGTGGDTLLVDWTPDTLGNSWVREELTGTIDMEVDEGQPGTLEATGIGTSERVLYSAKPNSDTTDQSLGDVKVEFTVGSSFSTGSDNCVCLIARYEDSSNYCWAVIYDSDTSTNAYIGDTVGGTVTDRASSGGNTWSAGDRIALIVNGSAISLEHNETQILSATTSQTDAGRYGLGGGNVRNATDEPASSLEMTRFRAWEITAATTPKGPLGMPFHGPFGGPLSV